MQLDLSLAAPSEIPPDAFDLPLNHFTLCAPRFDEDAFGIPMDETPLVTASQREEPLAVTFNLGLDAFSIPAEPFMTSPLSFSENVFTIPIDSPPSPSPQLATHTSLSR
jgi:hypothetical protein